MGFDSGLNLSCRLAKASIGVDATRTGGLDANRKITMGWAVRSKRVSRDWNQLWAVPNPW
jgi:hypothetical protein